MSFQDLDPEILQQLESYDEHEYVRRFVLADDIVCFIAVHNTNLGPALGGCRMREYENELDALDDVLRLSRGMTYKNAMAGLPLGGGKAVIIGNHYTQKTETLMQEVGKAVESFEGAYITAEDSGTGEQDMVAIANQTEHVVGLPPEMFEGSDYGELGGNPSPLTALGCYHGIKAAIAHRFEGQEKLNGMTVAIQGTGAVGFEICKLLKQDDVKLIVTDVNQESLDAVKKEFSDVEIVAPDEIYGVDADIFVPCAMGGALNDVTIEKLKAKIVAGAANNQLLSPYHDKMLASKDILYVPDYVINSGGVICVGYEYFRKTGYNPQDYTIDRTNMVSHVESIGAVVTEILEEAKKRGLPTGETADKLAEERFLKGGALNDNANSEDPSSFGSTGGTRLVQ